MHRRIILVAFFFIPALLLGFLILGCGQNTESPDFIPHEDGYRWEYKSYFLIGTSETSVYKKTRYFDGTTTLSSGLTVQNFIASEEAISQTTKAFGAINVFGLPLSSFLSYCYIDETGVYSYGSSSHPTTEVILIIPLPLEVGREWERRHGELSLACEAVTTEAVTVPAGTFNAIKVELTESGTTESDWYEWYADGVGMVKISMDVLVATIEGNRIIPEAGYYIEELSSKNF